MMTLIIGKRCCDGVILGADRRSLRGLEPNEQNKINQIRLEIDSVKSQILLAGAGVGAFWEEIAWSSEHYINGINEPKVKTFIDAVSGVSLLSTNLSVRYQHGGMDGRRQLLLPVNDNYICRFPSFLFWSFLLSGLRCWAAAVR